jgi:hypothetical protein
MDGYHPIYLIQMMQLMFFLAKMEHQYSAFYSQINQTNDFLRDWISLSHKKLPSDAIILKFKSIKHNSRR